MGGEVVAPAKWMRRNVSSLGGSCGGLRKRRNHFFEFGEALEVSKTLHATDHGSQGDEKDFTEVVLHCVSFSSHSARLDPLPK